MTARDVDGGLLGPPGEFDKAPPPAADLLNAVGAMKPVRTRTRFGAFARVPAIEGGADAEIDLARAHRQAP